MRILSEIVQSIGKQKSVIEVNDLRSHNRNLRITYEIRE